MNTPVKTANRRLSAGFTLLEVILALAILAGAVAILGQVMQLASRNASDAYAESRAQILAASVMNEIASGMVQREDSVREPLEVEDTVPWLYSVTISEPSLKGLTAVEVLVEQDLEKQFHPAHYRLIRWLPDAVSSSEPSSNADNSEST